MIIDGGIEFENYNKTIDIINKQIDSLKSGDFSDDDIEISKKAIKTSIESIKDSVFLISEFFFSQGVSKDSRSLDEILSDFETVTRNEIITAANKIVMDTIYFMKNKN